jgi:hypothetical protein
MVLNGVSSRFGNLDLSTYSHTLVNFLLGVGGGLDTPITLLYAIGIKERFSRARRAREFWGGGGIGRKIDSVGKREFPFKRTFP